MRPKLFFFLTISLLASLWLASRFIQPVPVISSSEEQFYSNSSGSSIVQFVFQPNIPEVASMVENVLHEITKKVKSNQRVEVSLISDSGINVIFSKRPTKRAIRGLHKYIDVNQSTPGIDPIPSSETRLVDAVQRFRDRVLASKGNSIHFYLVTSGTSAPQTIKRIQDICRSLSQQNLQNAHLYVLGLSSNHRIPISQGFSPIGAHVEFASADYNEWIQLIRKF
jgi:hypothetical protein